jgi:hypothetical protein
MSRGQGQVLGRCESGASSYYVRTMVSVRRSQVLVSISACSGSCSGLARVAEQSTRTAAFSKMLSNIGIPKIIDSDQGRKFRNASLQNKNGYKTNFFSLAHALSIEVFTHRI